MPDLVDRAQALADLLPGDALRARDMARPQREVSADPACRACGETIEPARRRAVPGCALCRDCQDEAERMGRVRWA